MRSGCLYCGLLAAGLIMVLAAPAGAVPVKAAVVRSTGTMFLGQTIWRELNAGWADFGETPVEIDYTSLGNYGLTLPQIEATGADVLIISCAGFYPYQESEIDAIIDYVEAGHGLIITYFSFYQNNARLAPLVGLDESIQLGTSTFWEGFVLDPLVPEHTVLAGVPDPYATGVPYVAIPSDDGLTWDIDAGTVIAEAWLRFGSFVGRSVIVANETPDYRGLYFGHYIEDRSGGSNEQDMQVFYNGLLWTAGVPEPAAGLMVVLGCFFMLRKRQL